MVHMYCIFFTCLHPIFMGVVHRMSARAFSLVQSTLGFPYQKLTGFMLSLPARIIAICEEHWAIQQRRLQDGVEA